MRAASRSDRRVFLAWPAVLDLRQCGGRLRVLAAPVQTPRERHRGGRHPVGILKPAGGRRGGGQHGFRFVQSRQINPRFPGERGDVHQHLVAPRPPGVLPRIVQRGVRITRAAALQEARSRSQRSNGGAVPLVPPREAADRMAQLAHPGTVPATIDEILRRVDPLAQRGQLSRDRPEALHVGRGRRFDLFRRPVGDARLGDT